MRLKALVEIYTMHSFAQLQNHIFQKNSRICQNLRKFSKILRNSQFFKSIFCENFEIAAVQKNANLVVREKCCQTHIFLQNFVLIQPRTSPPKICKIFEKCIFEKCIFEKCIFEKCIFEKCIFEKCEARVAGDAEAQAAVAAARDAAAAAPATRRVVANFWQKFGKMLLVFGCIGTDFCKNICVLQHFSKSTRFSS